MFYEWSPYVPVAERRRQAAREMQKLKKKGHPVSPVVVQGRLIAKTFWGKAWCENLEGYSDLSNRLPRGRTYVRNGSVVDLQISPGAVTAIVSGSELYRVAVRVEAVPAARWASICTDCTGGIDSLVELLQGRFSQGVMDRVSQQKTGLFPAPAEIHFSCSCPDGAAMCKHVAAVLYGIGSRLDERPELLFRLRKVDEKELFAKAGHGLPLSKRRPLANRLVATDDLSGLFGLEMGDAPPKARAGPRPARASKTGKVSLPVEGRRAASGSRPAKSGARKGRGDRGNATPTSRAGSRKSR
ncbi:MAG: SWIM zinc finger family protein [Myxococcota bacterium]|nr:SWIM zinc finger family protein [Myxococcota bacterium]